MKKVVALLLTLVLMYSMSVSAIAAVPETMVPLWTNISGITSNITFNGTSGSAFGSITGKSGTDEISATLSIYVQSGSTWVLVGRDSDTITISYLVLSVNFTGTSGRYYKSVLEVTVTIDGVEETETITKYKTC